MAGGWAAPSTIWPHIFGRDADDGTSVPSVGADMSEFTWEAPSAETAAAELEALMHGARVTVPTEPDPAAGMKPPPLPAMPPPSRVPETALRPGSPPSAPPDVMWP